MVDERSDPVATIRSAATAFVSGQLTGPDFESRFLAVFSDVPSSAGHDFNQAAEDVFWAVEDYVSDPAIREPGDLDEDELRSVVALILPRLGVT